MAEDDGTPSFGEVVKAFTPPGTDFDEFRRSLHSQGAPGRISPEMVAMLNQVAPQIAGQQSGTLCPRCEHPHGGPPGRACLEAEAHLGRSPARRSPDLQLDEISAHDPRDRCRDCRSLAGSDHLPDCPQASPAALLPGMASVAAIGAHEMFTDFLRAGFTEDQALTLVARIITSHPGGGADE